VNNLVKVNFSKKCTKSSLPIDVIKFDPRIYPRLKPSQEDIERYAELVKAGIQFPPIIVDQHIRLIDGYHRWRATQLAGRSVIETETIVVSNDEQALAIACALNAVQGVQLTPEERRVNAIRLYTTACKGFTLPSEEKVKEIAKAVGVSRTTVYRWTEHIRQQIKEQKLKKIGELRGKAKSQAEIARIVGVSQPTVSRVTESCFIHSSHLGEMNSSLDLNTRRGCEKAMKMIIEHVDELVQWSKEDERKIWEQYQQRKREKQKYGIPLSAYDQFKNEIEQNTAIIFKSLETIEKYTLGLITTVRDEQIKREIQDKVRPLFERMRKFEELCMGNDCFLKIEIFSKLIRLLEADYHNQHSANRWRF